MAYDIGKGLVFSMCNIVFGKLDKNEEGNIRFRQGGEHDINKLASCFGGSYLNVDHIFKPNLEKNEIKHELERVRRKLEADNEYKYLIVLMSSHGATYEGREIIFDTENSLVDIQNEIVGPFHNEKFKKFAGRPKIFILNCCRGIMPHKYEPKTDGIRSTSKTQLQLSKADVCIIWSTVEEAASIRFPTEGSPLIQSLCGMIIDKAIDKTLQSTPFVRALIPDLSEEVRRKHGTQIEYKSSFAKSFYLQLKGKSRNSSHEYFEIFEFEIAWNPWLTCFNF